MNNNDGFDNQYFIELGAKIHSARKSLHKTLEDIAQEIGVTRSFLSQVERGISPPSITTLRNIAKALRIPVFLLFTTVSESRNKVVRKDERQTIVLPQATAAYQLLSPDLNRKIEMILTELEPESSSCDEPLFHNGEECAFMLSGRALIEVGEENFVLEEGDSLYFDCSIPHRISNIGKNVVKIVSAITPPNF